MIGEIVTGILDGMFNVVSSRDEEAMKAYVASWLRKHKYHVCDGDNELRQLALEETDLVEPNAQE